jgi:two-component system, chemotaxis family, CheB/CheR fusion protein
MLGIVSENVGQNLSDMSFYFKPVELQPLIRRAYSQSRYFSVENILLQLPTGQTMRVDVQIHPLLDQTGNALGISVSFVDMTRYYCAQEELEKSKEDLGKAYEEIQYTNEELQSANEEMETMN